MGIGSDNNYPQLKHRVDVTTAILLAILASFGLFILITISPSLFAQQIIYYIIGIALLVILSKIDGLIWWWFAPIGFIVAIIFILLSYLGPEIRGATRWIMIGGSQLQPSELVKPLLILAFSRFLVQFSPRKIKNLPILLILFFIPFILVFKQPDLGSSLVYLGFYFAMLLAAGLPMIIPALGLPVFALIIPIVWRFLAQYQKSRILTFLDPGLDPTGAGYNAMQAMIAVGSGQFFGRGLGFGTQSHLRFLPEFHTDFVFATLVEELGFLGGVVLIIIYLLLLWQILKPLVRGDIEDNLTYYYSVGLLAMILTQIFINAGMNMGIVPITGITLPFVSYGGSSILSLAISFGIYWSLRGAKQ